jgi:chromate transport protein ChrA
MLELFLIVTMVVGDIWVLKTFHFGGYVQQMFLAFNAMAAGVILLYPYSITRKWFTEEMWREAAGWCFTIAGSIFLIQLLTRAAFGML